MATQTGVVKCAVAPQSIDRWCNIWRRKASALGGSARITCSTTGFGWYGLKHPARGMWRRGMACRSRQPGLLAPQIRRNGIARAEQRRGDPAHPLPLLLRSVPLPPSPSGGVCWVRSRQFGLNNHRPFLHQRRPLAPSCHAHRYGDLKMAGVLMQIALIVRHCLLRRRQFRATLVVNDCVCGSLQDGWSHFEHDTIKETVMR